MLKTETTVSLRFVQYNLLQFVSELMWIFLLFLQFFSGEQIFISLASACILETLQEFF